MKKNVTPIVCLLCITLISLTITGCKEDCTDGPCERQQCVIVCDSVNSAPEELLNYFVFNVGSHWVYQLKGTSILDTMSFAGIDSEYFEQKAECNFGITPCEMRYRVFYDHSNLERFPMHQGVSNESYSIAYSQSRNQWDVEHISHTKTASSLNFFLAYPFNINQQYSETTFLGDTVIEITVPSGTFKCIQTESQVANPEGVIMSMYWSKGIGLVQYQISTDQIWELIEYQHE